MGVRVAGGLASSGCALPVPCTGGVLRRPSPRPAAIGRAPAIHGRLSAHPLCTGRAPTVFGFGTEIKSVAAGTLLVIMSRRRGLEAAALLSLGSRHKSNPPGMQGGMPRAGHGWPAAGTGSRTAHIPAGHPPCIPGGRRRLHEASPHPRRAAQTTTKNQKFRNLLDQAKNQKKVAPFPGPLSFNLTLQIRNAGCTRGTCSGCPGCRTAGRTSSRRPAGCTAGSS